MRQITAEIRTRHRNPAVVAGALSPDNLQGMETCAEDGMVRMVLTGIRLRSVLASVDDYLMNLAEVEDLCSRVLP